MGEDCSSPGYLRGGKGLGGHIESALYLFAGIVDGEGNLITGGITAVAGYLDIDRFLHRRISTCALFISVIAALVELSILLRTCLTGRRKKTAGILLSVQMVKDKDLDISYP